VDALVFCAERDPDQRQPDGCRATPTDTADQVHNATARDGGDAVVRGETGDQTEQESSNAVTEPHLT
jgi:hypothetical protein